MIGAVETPGILKRREKTRCKKRCLVYYCSCKYGGKYTGIHTCLTFSRRVSQELIAVIIVGDNNWIDRQEVKKTNKLLFKHFQMFEPIQKVKTYKNFLRKSLLLS